MAHVASWVKGAELAGARTVRVRGDDPLAVHQSFAGITYITRVSEGRLRAPRPAGTWRARRPGFHRETLSAGTPR